MNLPEPSTPSLRILLIHLFRRFVKPITRERRAEVQIQLRDSSNPDFDFFLLVVLSCVIATLGLLTDSPAVIIGAMLVAPLMSPIIGLGLASLTGDTTLFRNAGIALARGAVTAIMISTILTLGNRLLPFLPLQELPGEVLSRTRPTPIDLTIALAGGMAAAFAMAMPSISAALPGVAIATALMPPLCTVGVGIAMGRWDVAGGALLLFVTNAVTIAFAAMLVFSAVGFTIKREEGRIVPRALVVTAIFTLVLLIPLTLLSYKFFRDATENGRINDVVTQEVTRYGAELADLNIVQVEDTLQLDLTIRTSEPLSYEDVNQMQQDIAFNLQQEVSIIVNQIVAARLNPLIPPTFTPTATPATLTPTSSSTPTTTPTATATYTPIPPTFTPTPSSAQVVNTNGRTIDILQTPDGPSIGKLRAGDPIILLYQTDVFDGLVWLQIMDKDGRIGWIPQINISVVTSTPAP